MGGRLFNLPRMQRADYLERERLVRTCLDQRLSGAYRIPRYYGAKLDFGDLDILVADREDWQSVREGIMRDLNITESRAVGAVFSTVFRGLQTDFFVTQERLLDARYNFMSFNDLGNFIGRICRRLDLKYGEDGLSYIYRSANGDFVREIEVTLDFAKICGFIDLDYDHWCKGFETLPEMFAWVIASRYFSVAPYLDGRDATMKKRASDRPTVARFIEHLVEHRIDKRPDLGDRRDHLNEVIAAFPEACLESKLDEARKDEAQRAMRRARFNGERVMGLVPGLEGRELGVLMAAIRNSRPDFDAWLSNAAEDDIDRHILQIAQERNQMT